ncbi:caspase family protein [Streptomyces ficellus]|uniref:Caspase family protein n=1 Tax=Streptomyces ficellus TaxID=1977088 RepID=A0A6I6F0J5_9ACTN|nr:caspase family protein [Streptomyces ficellus]QGV77443.1 caspase family protein [Streptomyces ficellus]
MGSFYALMAGIDDYPPAVATPLAGCLNDIAAAGGLVRDRVPAGGLRMVTLLNADATREAVEAGIRDHLGQAGPGDTALFWFSGHGTQSRAVDEAHLRIEATGRNQALVCADGPLLDKRLGAHLDAVAARGAHVAAILDCCFSGGATRDPRRTARYAPPAAHWRLDDNTPPPAEPSPAVRDAGSGGGPVPRHVLMAASRLDQLSYEGDHDGRRHGAFTHALLGAVRDAAPDASYRTLLSAADARLRRSGGWQRPVLYPAEAGGVADLPFLGGAPRRAPAPYLLRLGADGWEVDCGAVHGLPEGTAGAGALFAPLTPDGGTPGAGAAVRARVVEAGRTLVDPVDWTPSPGRAHPVALTALPQPPAAVTVTTATTTTGAVNATASGRTGAEDDLRRSIAASPLLELTDGTAGPGPGDLHLRVHIEGTRAHVLRHDGTPFTDALALTGREDADRVAACLTHLTRWHQIRDLAPGPSALDGLVRVEITPFDGDEPLVPDGNGDLVCAYTPGPDGFRAPKVRVRLHNRSVDRTLWCVLVDLTDSYASHTSLYPGHFIGPGRTGHALDGDPVQLSLPAGRPVVPGASTQDWLKLIVSTSELNTVPYHQRPWDAAAPVAARDMGAVPAPAGHRWATRTVRLRTVVPEL